MSGRAAGVSLSAYKVSVYSCVPASLEHGDVYEAAVPSLLDPMCHEPSSASPYGISETEGSIPHSVKYELGGAKK